MMWPTDATRLAVTKLKTRKVRLVITLVLSSILFSVLLGASFIVRGTINSVEGFSKSGFGDRYLASGTPIVNSYYQVLSDPTLVQKAQAMQAANQAAKKAEAKKLGISYDPQSDQPYLFDNTGPSGKDKQVNTAIPEVAAMVSDYMKNQPGQEAGFDKVAHDAHATNLYHSVMRGGDPTSGSLSVLVDGKEDYTKTGQQGFSSPNGIAAFPQQWNLMSAGLMKPFVLQGQSLQVGKDGSIPVIAPFSAAEELIGLKALPSTATAQDRLNRLKELRTKAAGKTFTICYRNSTSASDLQQAIQQQADITAHKGDKDYQTPPYVLGLPDQPCGAPGVARDVRTADEKSLATKQAQFDTDFGKPGADSQIVTMRIVGINADVNMGGAATIVQIFQSVLLSSLGPGWFTPIEATTQSPVVGKVFGLTDSSQGLMQWTYYAEFNNPQTIKSFISSQNCTPNYSVMGGGDVANFTTECAKQGKYFMVASFGSSSVAIDQIKHGFNKFFKYAAIVVAILATIIMMGTVGRIIADSRRETAVFRAIGGKRFDIGQIYFTYSAMVSVLILLISLVLGLLVAHFVDSRYSESLTVNALVAFNVPDLSSRFHMTGFNARDVILVALVIFVTGLVATLLPLILNVRRNPIRDMRDDR